jgi:hypothetical protein
MNKQLRSLDLSKFHFHSYGIVAEDNIDNNTEIKIFPVEKLYFENGEALVKKGNLDKDELYKPTDLKLKEKVLKVVPEDIELRQLLPEEVLPLEKTKYLYVEWCGLNNPNRYTPPNVCKGEKVIVYKYSNADIYFWDTLGFELNLRKEDHVVDVYSDKPEINEGDVKAGIDEDLEDTYYIMKSPKNKILKIHTTDKYGELTTYDITIKTDEGYIEVIDGKGNFFKLDSDGDDFITNINNNVKTDIGNDKTTNVGNDVNETIGNNKVVTLKKIAIQNDTTELISLLSEYIQTHIEEQHIGNLGIPTNLTGDFISKYTDIKSRLDSLKI